MKAVRPRKQKEDTKHREKQTQQVRWRKAKANSSVANCWAIKAPSTALERVRAVFAADRRQAVGVRFGKPRDSWAVQNGARRNPSDPGEFSENIQP